MAATAASERFTRLRVFHGALLFEFAAFFQKHFDGNTGKGQSNQSNTNSNDNQQ